MGESSGTSQMQLPDRAIKGLELLVENHGVLEDISKIIGETKDLYHKDKLISKLVDKLGLNWEDAGLLLISVVNFRASLTENGLAADDLMAGLKKCYLESQGPAASAEEIIRQREEAWDSAAKEIQCALAEDNNFSILEKFDRVVYSHQCILVDSCVFTDIRPLYDDNMEDMSRVVVLHKLELKYHEGNERRILQVALDSADIDKLERLCQRAREKADIASKKMKNVGLVAYIVGDDDE